MAGRAIFIDISVRSSLSQPGSGQAGSMFHSWGNYLPHASLRLKLSQGYSRTTARRKENLEEAIRSRLEEARHVLTSSLLSADLQICVFSCAVRNYVMLIKACDWRRWRSLTVSCSARLTPVEWSGMLLCEVSEEGHSLPIGVSRSGGPVEHCR